MGYYPYYILGIFLLMVSTWEVFFYKEREGWHNKIFYATLFIVTCFFMTRWYVGWDWYNYLDDFYNESMNYEWGYRYFQKLIRWIYPNYSFFVGVNSIIDFLIIGYILKKHVKYPIFTLFLYLGIGGLSLEVDIMRNVKSILFFIVSIEFIERKKIFPYMLLNIIGALFHVSSLLYLPLYFILGKKMNRKLILGVFILGLSYYFLNFNIWIDIIGKINISRLNGYKEFFSYGGRGINLFFIERVIFFAITYIGSGYIQEKDRGFYTIIENSSYLSIFLYLFSSELLIITLRLILLFSYAYWLLPPILIKNLSFNRGLKSIVYILSVSILLFRSYNFLSFKGNKMVYGYENLLYKEKSVEEKKIIIKEARKYNIEGSKKELLLQY